MVRFHVRKFRFLLGLAVTSAAALVAQAAPAEAQLWLGPAALEVRVKDSKGLPVSGAQVRLQFTALEPRDGPPPVLTDERGRAAAGGLADGVWTLEVSRDGFMTYMAEVAVREGGRPDVRQATQMQVPGATRLLEVEVYRSKAPRGARATPAPRETRPAPRPEPREEPAAPAPARPAPAPVQPAPTPAPQAPPQATPGTSRTPTTTTTPPAPAPAPAPVPVTPAPAPTAPQTPPAAPAPTPPPAAAQPAVAMPADTVRQRSSRDRTCPECPAGEASLSVERVLPAGGVAGGGCGGDIESRLRSGEVPAALPAGCHVLRAVLPAGTRYTAYRYEIQDGGDGRDCIAGQDCPTGAGRWPVNPVLVRRPEGTVVLAPFEAGASDRERRVVLTVYYATGRR